MMATHNLNTQASYRLTEQKCEACVFLLKHFKLLSEIVIIILSLKLYKSCFKRGPGHCCHAVSFELGSFKN